MSIIRTPPIFVGSPLPMIFAAIAIFSLIFLAAYFQRSKTPGPSVTYYWIDDFPGLTEVTRGATGNLFSIEEPIPVINNIARFRVTPLIGSQQGQEIQFYGDAQRLNAFASEILFVKLYLEQGKYELARNSAIGFKEGGQDLFKGIWSLGSGIWSSCSSLGALKRNSGKAWSEVGEIYDYGKAIFAGKKNVIADFNDLLEAYYTSEKCETADRHQFSYPECVTEDAKKFSDYETWSRMSGYGTEKIVEVLLPIGAAKWALKTSRCAKVAAGASGVVIAESTIEGAEGIQKGDEGLQALSKYNAKEFPIISKVSSSLKRVASFKNAESESAIIDARQSVLMASRETIANQANLTKLSTLTAERAANPRLNRILGAMFTIEKNGANLEAELDSLLPKGTQGEFYYSQPRLKKSLIDNYKYLKDICDLDEKDIRLLKRGNGIAITKGPNAGDITSVDHRIPKTYAPELDCNLNNLRILPLKVNCLRGAKIDVDAITAIHEYKDMGWVPDVSLVAETPHF